MTLGRRPSPSRKPAQSSRRAPNYASGGPPTWLVFLVGVALVFGLYYVWQGVSTYLSTRGMGIRESTELAISVNTSTAQRLATQTQSVFGTELPSATPPPNCADFRVIVRANVRQGAGTEFPVITSFGEGEILCVLGFEAEGQWAVLDLDPRTRRLETGYMTASALEAINPTPTPSNTWTPLPTVTDAPTPTASETAQPAPTPTRDPAASSTPTPRPTATVTQAVQSA
jgi:hypothetical protein